jgi:hypothetical protein
MTMRDPLPKYPPSSSTISHTLFSWVIPEIERERLDRYYLLKWESQYFYGNHSQFSTITHQNVEYNVVYLNNHTPKTLLSHTHILLSFRRVNGWERGYVIIQPYLGV